MLYRSDQYSGLVDPGELWRGLDYARKRNVTVMLVPAFVGRMVFRLCGTMSGRGKVCVRLKVWFIQGCCGVGRNKLM